MCSPWSLFAPWLSSTGTSSTFSYTCLLLVGTSFIDSVAARKLSVLVNNQLSQVADSCESHSSVLSSRAPNVADRRLRAIKLARAGRSASEENEVFAASMTVALSMDE